MRVATAVALFCLGLALMACGSGETTTVTETVATAEAGGSAAAPEAATEGTRGAVPTSTTIPDGTWTESEYTPGTYRAPGGELCSWEKRQKLSQEAEGTGNWGGAEKNIVAEIDSPYFKTEGCGTWERVE